MKHVFFVRWFHNWKKRRLVSSAWQMRVYPPCLFCQRPIPEQSAFCNWCGAAQTKERNTTGSMLAESVSISDVATTPVQPAVGRKYDITNELQKAPKGQRPFETFNKMIHGDQRVNRRR